MIITPHIIAGAAIGSKISSFWLVAIISLTVHYLLDVIPHREYATEILKKKIYGRQMANDLLKLGLDFFIGLVLVAVFLDKSAYGNLNHILVGIFFSILPDIFSFFKIVFNSRIFEYHSRFHELIHIFEGKGVPAWIEIGSQIAVSIVGILIINN